VALAAEHESGNWLRVATSTAAYISIPLTGSRDTARRLDGLSYFAKCLLDRALAAVLLLLLLPLIGLIGLLIRLDSQGPVFFKQIRVTRHGRLFIMYKFRSMFDGADALHRQLSANNGDYAPLFKMREDPRITRTGRWLRRTSLDELPQLINVLRGEMSLVGPRPPLVTEVASDWRHMARLEAMAGMTGLWQVSGRSELSFDEMLQLDLQYIERWSLPSDCLIILKTIPTVIARRGAY
jgi:lipopolysaccharide/colanic/teichoic acid biosynthesis glycosyltransferase